ncbi:MAG: FAD-dependent oxidoreductase [Cyclobacteriaceae bacterium]
MIVENHESAVRNHYHKFHQKDVVVVGGGLAGVCAAITAARAGKSVVLVQDRPVLGGNASSEVRMWVLGATSHMGNNNRWAREGGVLDEILIENLYRNKEGNAIIFDTILLELVDREPNITLLLNTAIYEVEKQSDSVIKLVKGFCSLTQTVHSVSGSVFIDASGDGVIGFLAGAPFRMGAENKSEFGELFAPDADYGKMLGHTIYFYSRDIGKPVTYVPPAFALKDVTKIPRYKSINASMQGCQFWWFEYGGREADTIVESENIKWELWKIVYGVWDYIKNSGEFPEAETLTLDWVGTIPGKRESRRFEGQYMMKQQDIVNQKQFEDAVAFGGWAIDLHPGDGVYSKLPGCDQYHTKGIYEIPYRAYVSSLMDNLLFAGRIISASHVAFGSTRVMATCAHGAQAVAEAAALAIEKKVSPNRLEEAGLIPELQNRLNINGQGIPAKPIDFDAIGVEKPIIEASSNFHISHLPFDSEWETLAEGFAQLLPLKAQTSYSFEFMVKAEEETEIVVELRSSSKKGNYTPDVVVQSKKVRVSCSKGQIVESGVAGAEYFPVDGPDNLQEQVVSVSFDQVLNEDDYAFFTILPNDKVEVMTSQTRLTGTLANFKKINKAVSNNGYQAAPDGSGFDSFEFWTPKRRPEGRNLAFKCSPPINISDIEHLSNGYLRPYLRSNAWIADSSDNSPELRVKWKSSQEISRIRLYFDTDYDHPLENVLMSHPESVIPFCVRNYRILDQDNNLIFEKKDNYQTINDVRFEDPIKASELIFKFDHPSNRVPAAVFELAFFND